ncbi:MAG: hypothetical protein R3E32_09285 [Chitinophagales bacterium]
MKNKMYFFIVSILIISCTYKTNKNNDLYNVVIRSDSTFVTYNDTLSKREEVHMRVFQKINDIIELNFYETKYEKDKIDGIFMVKYSDEINIYVVKLKSFAILYYTVFAENIKTGKLSSNPFYINGKWMENNEAGFRFESRLLEEPLLYFKDINEDSKKEIVIKERVHNGTVYNGVIENYYSVDNDMNMNLSAAIETKYIDLHYDDCLIIRDLEKGVIKVRLKCKDSEIIDIGEVYLSYEESKVQIDSSKLFIEEYEELLITGSGIEDSVFLNEGYKFAY